MLLASALLLSLVALYPSYSSVSFKGRKEFNKRALLPLIDFEGRFPRLTLVLSSNGSVEVSLKAGAGREVLKATLAPFEPARFNLSDVATPLVLRASSNHSAVISYECNGVRLLKPYTILGLPAVFVGLVGLGLIIRATYLLAGEIRRR